MNRAVPLVVLSALLVAGCTTPGSTVPPAESAAPTPVLATPEPIGAAAVSGASGGTGGTVRDVPAHFPVFTSLTTSAENGGGESITLVGSVKDPNGEEDLGTLRAWATGATVQLSSNHTVTSDERSATAEPAAFGEDGWKVWTGTLRDGILHFKARLNVAAFAPAGAYALSASSTSPTSVVSVLPASQAIAFTISAFSSITVGSAPVDAAGNALAGANWGEWTADPGATNVGSSNYLKLVNTGTIAEVSLVIDFSEAAFSGASDGNYSIPINGNVEFAVFEDTTPLSTAPSEGTFTFAPASADGGVRVDFTGAGNIVYVTYRIVALPEILPAQSYGATFTVTEL